MQTTCALSTQACALGPRLPRAGLRAGCSRAAALLPSRRAPVHVTAQRDEGNKPGGGGGGRDEPGYSINPLSPAFTRRREHTVGRIAALGFGFSLVGELLTGIGPITQLHYETGLSYNLLYTILLGLTAFGLIGALRPGSPTWDRSNITDVQKRGPPANLFREPRRFFVQNEVYIGRLAMAGFAGAVVLEYMWNGEAPLAHLGFIQPGTNLAGAPWWMLVLLPLLLATGLGLFSSLGSTGGDAENY